jgi:predicted nucleic-acid-binding protein
MISVDTNLLVRLLTRDHESQYKKARALFKSEQVFIPDTGIQEAEWALRVTYQFSAAEINNAFTLLFGLKNIHLSNPALIAKAIDWHQQGMDFSDALHLAQSQHCERLYTFDKKFLVKTKTLSNCLVSAP